MKRPNVSSWVVILPHYGIRKEFFETMVDKYNVVALLVLSDSVVESSSMFLKPEFIGVID